MSKKFIPYDKLSKKKKREINRQKRGDTIPAPRIIPDKHREQRDKEKYEFY